MVALKKTIAAIIFLGAAGVIGWTSMYTVFDTEAEIQESAFSVEASVLPREFADPTRIIIPAINVDALVEHVGVKSNGNMATPTKFSDVGWYMWGPAPGERGNSVLAGHVDNAVGLAGVFKNLANVSIGDTVEVVNEVGEKVHFTVTRIETYGYQDAPADVIFNTQGDPQLVLITCGGDWIQEEKTYEKRIVVFAKIHTES